MKAKHLNRILFIMTLATVSAFAVFFSSCATVKAREEAKVEFTAEEEYYIGRAVAANVLTAYKLQTSKPAQIAYLNRICGALVINSARPEIFNGYHVNILESDEINAFATPGGHIFITRALIESAASEDTLAAVIAHEIGHIQLSHGLGAISKSRMDEATKAGLRQDYSNVKTGFSAASALGLDQLLESATGLPVTDVTSAVNTVTGAVDTVASGLQQLAGVFGLSIGDIVTTMMNNGYSRDQEFAADSTALELMVLAGYEPSSLVDMLRVLEKTQGAHPGGFNKTHPSPADRIAGAQKSIANYTVGDTRSYREARYAAAAR